MNARQVRCAFASIAACALLGAAPPALVQVDDLQRLVALGSPAISADGRYAALVVSRTLWDDDRRSRVLALVDLRDGSAQTIVSKLNGLADPAFSPDGTQLAFVANQTIGTTTRAQVYVVPAVGGDPKVVTRAADDVDAFSWRPDGRGLAYAAADGAPNRSGADRFRDSFLFTTEPITARALPQSVHLFTTSLDDGSMEQLTTGPESVGDGSPLSWSPDGKSIAVTLCRNEITNDQSYSRAVLVDAASGRIRNLTGRTIWESNPVYSPDGAHIAYLYSNGDPEVTQTKLYLTTPSGGRGIVLSRRLDRPIGDVVWSSDSKSLIATAPDATTNSLYRITLDGSLRRLDIGNVVPGVPLNTTGGASTPALGNALAADGKLVFLGSATAQPLELFRYSPSGGTAKVTDFNAALSAFTWATAERLTFPTTTGVSGDGVLYYPPGFSRDRKYPLVVFIHGGPGDPTMMEFDFWAQVMAAHGWLVLRPNYRGTPNLGAKYLSAILYDPEDGPGKDIVAAIGAVRAQGIVDAERIAVCGWSYGGIMTAWMIGKYHFWRVAVSGASVNDWIADYGTADDSMADLDMLHGSPFVGNNAAEWRRVSAISYAADVTTPVLILSDVGDNRDPFASSSMYWRALRDNHKDATLRVWPIDGHFPDDPVRIADVYRYWIEYIAQHF